MATSPIVQFTLDLTSTPLAATAVTLSTSNVPTVNQYLTIDCSKASFFGSGLVYNITTNASGIVTSIVGQANASSVNQTHLRNQAGAASDFVFNTNQSIYDLSYNFLGVPRTVKFNVAKAQTLVVPPKHIGRDIMYMVTHAVQIRDPVTQNDVFDEASLTTAAGLIADRITTVIATAVGTQAGQDAILQTVLASNGPLITLPTTASTTTPGILTYTSDLNGLSLMFTLVNMPVSVTLNPAGVTREIVLRSVPVLVRINT
jgi:hypothetical protein